MEFYEKLQSDLKKLAGDELDETVHVLSARTLSAQEAIGNPERKDFPLLKGKEVMIEASFKGFKGHAYTNMPGDFSGLLSNIVQMPLATNFDRAVLVASLNAVMCSHGLITNTIHCIDNEPEECAQQLSDTIMSRFGHPKIAFVGFQPAMIDRMSELFKLRVIDLDEDNIGKEKFNILIEGPDNTEDVLSWSDIILATGSTCVNTTITRFLGKKPVIFYGVTIAGIAKTYGFERHCPCAH
ncbi:MAG: hypothetical protein C0399_12385 [Syntrophus sp. (in: bacteria)]|nr:hypothetical protein [Syntrophus sp. (in: bacteria)]